MSAMMEKPGAGGQVIRGMYNTVQEEEAKKNFSYSAAQKSQQSSSASSSATPNRGTTTVVRGAPLLSPESGSTGLKTTLG